MTSKNTLLTSKGNLKSKTITNQVLIDKRTHKIVKYWQKQGFPYYTTDKTYRQEKWDAFLKVDDAKSLDFKNRTFKSNTAGLSLCWSYFPSAWEVQCKDMKTPYDVFTDYDLFSKGIRKILTGSFFPKKTFEYLMSNNEQTKSALRQMLRRVTGVQMVSNFRPVTSSMLYKVFCDKGDTIWDPSCGWGGRLLSSIKADVNYIGTDPNTITQIGLHEIAKTFGNNTRTIELHTLGSEVFRPDKSSLDFAFTSPPYFNTERYSETEETQSYIKFSNINVWKEEFLRKTLENAHYGLKPNKFLAFNVADVKGQYETFEKDTKQIALETGFKLVDTFDLRMSSQEGSHKDEPIFIFKCIK